jgi:ribose/xylose/arabinose/galactoside ABC-type transport system permease subunit
MGDLGRVLVFFGLLLAVVGIFLIFAGRAHVPLGRLPGDFTWRGKHSVFYFPLATSILLSIALSLVFWLINRFTR